LDRFRPGIWFLLFLAAVLALLFSESFEPGKVQLSNDSPLGFYTADWYAPPRAFTGLWDDLNSIGLNAGVWPVSFSALVRWILGPVGHSKFFVPITLVFLACCARIFLLRLKFSPWVSSAGALAVALCSGYFSATCWGVGTQVVAIGYQFLA